MNRRPHILSAWLVAAGTLGAAAVTPAGAQLIYDAGLGSTPGAQGWLYLTNPPFGASSSGSVTGGVLTFDSTPVRSESAGFFNTSHPVRPVLDSEAGFALGWTLQIHEELHVSNSRAGFSLIVLDQDHRGIELGFWEDSVWAQNDDPLFVRAETATWDTTAGLIEYRLEVSDDAWVLFADDQTLLSGPVRDYSAFSGFPDPYSQTDFVFFGDNTSSASARWSMTRMAWVLPGDFNADGLVDMTDIQRLGEAVRGDREGGVFDLNADGQVDRLDLQWLLEEVLETRIGDVNLDGRVDDIDLAILRSNLGNLEPAGYAEGDLSFSGRVDLYDAYLLFKHYGFDRDAVSTTTTIPEPASWLMFAGAGILVLRIGRSRSRSC